MVVMTPSRPNLRTISERRQLQLNLLEIIYSDGVSGVLRILLSRGRFERKERVMLELGVLPVVVVAALLLLVEWEGVEQRLLAPLQVPPHLQTKQE